MLQLFKLANQFANQFRSCECDFVVPFNEFLEANALLVRDYDIVQCVSENAIKDCSKSKSVGNRKNKSLDEITTTSSSNSSNNITAEIVVPVALAAVATILLILAVFVFR